MKEKIFIENTTDVYSILDKYKNKTVEHFGLICLDGAQQVIKNKVLFKGGYTCSTVDVRVILFEAIKCRACSVIIWHNHPSGNVNPSKDDISTTNRIKVAVNICGMQLLDSMIIGKYDYYSFMYHNQLEETNCKVAN